MVTRGFTGRPPPQETSERLPPAQYLTDDFPVQQFRPTPQLRSEDWRFTLREGAQPAKSWTWDEFSAVQRTRWQGNIHCLTNWSKFDTTWEGVSIDDVLGDAGIAAPTAFTLAEGYGDCSTDLPFPDLNGGRALVAILNDGQSIPPWRGGKAAGAASIFLAERQMAETPALHAGARGRVLGAARLSHLWRSLVRTAVHQ